MSGMTAVSVAFVRTLPLMLVLAGVFALGLVLTDGADWVSFAGFFGGLLILFYAGQRELDRWHARED